MSGFNFLNRLYGIADMAKNTLPFGGIQAELIRNYFKIWIKINFIIRRTFRLLSENQWNEQQFLFMTEYAAGGLAVGFKILNFCGRQIK